MSGFAAQSPPNSITFESYLKARGSCECYPSCGGPTRCGGLWDGLVDAGAKAAADRNVTGGVVGLPALVPQLLLSPPLCSSI